MLYRLYTLYQQEIFLLLWEGYAKLLLYLGGGNHFVINVVFMIIPSIISIIFSGGLNLLFTRFFLYKINNIRTSKDRISRLHYSNLKFSGCSINLLKWQNLYFSYVLITLMKKIK